MNNNNHHNNLIPSFFLVSHSYNSHRGKENQILDFSDKKYKTHSSQQGRQAAAERHFLGSRILGMDDSRESENPKVHKDVQKNVLLRHT